MRHLRKVLKVPKIFCPYCTGIRRPFFNKSGLTKHINSTHHAQGTALRKPAQAGPEEGRLDDLLEQNDAQDPPRHTEPEDPPEAGQKFTHPIIDGMSSFYL